MSHLGKVPLIYCIDNANNEIFKILFEFYRKQGGYDTEKLTKVYF